MFDAPPSAALQGAAGGREGAGAEGGSDDEGEDEDEDDEDGESQGARARERAGKGAVGAAVLAMLQRVAEEQAVEIAQVCRCAPNQAQARLPYMLVCRGARGWVRKPARVRPRRAVMV